MNIIDLLRQYRVGPFAVFDFVISYLGFYLLSPFIIKLFLFFNLKINKTGIMWLVLPTSILVHILVGEYTPLTKMFLDGSEYYLVKAIVIFTIYMGIKEISFK